MTQPIQEPTVPRALAGSRWNENQLYRRPVPRVETTYPSFVGFKTSTLTLTSGNSGRLNWDQWAIYDNTVFDAGTISGGDLTDIELLVDGVYAIHCHAYWDTQPASGFGGILMIHDHTDIFEPSICQGVTYPTNFHVQGAMSFQIVRYLPPEFQNADPPMADRLEFWAIQNSGVSRDIDQAFCEIFYLGPRSDESPVS